VANGHRHRGAGHTPRGQGVKRIERRHYRAMGHALFLGRCVGLTRRSSATDPLAVRVLFTTLPATGHFNSLVPLALAVRSAGHEVAICTASGFADQVEALGLQHLPGGVARFSELFVGAPPSSDPARLTFAQRIAFGRRAPERLIPDLLRHVDAWQPDLLVRESGEQAAAIVAEKVGLPHAGISGGAWASHDARRGLLAEPMGAHRARLGMEADPENHMIFRYLQFAFTPPAWDGDDPVPDTLHHIRYDNPERPDEAPLPTWLEAPRSRPLVFASLGTVMHSEPGLMEAVVAALDGEPVDALAAIGRDQDPARFGDAPPNVRLEPFVPQLRVLERSDLFVTHGGFNGTKEALRLGLPLVVIPISGDQPYTAQRVAALGLGVAIDRTERSPARIRAAVRHVLAEDRYRTNARAFASAMAALPPIGHAVALLERLARDRQPIPRPAS
jgi:UDP:flavonoid glycosyltransferase YjiC (YdhE family)